MIVYGPKRMPVHTNCKVGPTALFRLETTLVQHTNAHHGLPWQIFYHFLEKYRKVVRMTSHFISVKFLQAVSSSGSNNKARQ